MQRWVWVCLLGASAWVADARAQDAVPADAGTPVEPVLPPTAAEPAIQPVAAPVTTTEQAHDSERVVPAEREQRVSQDSPAASSHGPYFGGRGLVLSANTSLASSTTDYASFESSSDSARLTIGADVFAASVISLGVEVEITRNSQSSTSSNGISVDSTDVVTRGGVRVGWAIPLGESVSLFPRLAFGLQHTARRENALSNTPFGGLAARELSATRDGPWLSLYIPLLLHVEPDFFVGFGPSVFHHFARSTGEVAPGGALTRVAAAIELGGVLFGPNVASDTREPRVSAAHAFSQRGSVILSGALQFGGAVEWSAGAGATSNAISIVPGVDYFFSDRVSFGGSIGYTTDSRSEFSGNQKLIVRSHSFIIAPRFGFDAVLGPSFSVYSLISLGSYISGASVQSRSGGTESGDWKRLNVKLSSYVLVHPVGHLFIGFGPSLDRDIALTGDVDHSLTYAMSTIVGGRF